MANFYARLPIFTKIKSLDDRMFLRIGYNISRIVVAPSESAAATSSNYIDISSITTYPTYYSKWMNTGTGINFSFRVAKVVLNLEGVSDLYLCVESTSLFATIKRAKCNLYGNFTGYDEIPATNLASYYSSFKTFINEEMSRRGRSTITTTNPTAKQTLISASHINSFITPLNSFAYTTWQVSNVTSKQTLIAVGANNQYTKTIVNFAALKTVPKEAEVVTSEGYTSQESVGCQSSCTGLCTTTCTGSCDTGCTGTCTGGCGGSCSGSCTGGCQYGCGGGCGNNCNSDCWDQCTSSTSQSSSFNPGCGDCC